MANTVSDELVQVTGAELQVLDDAELDAVTGGLSLGGFTLGIGAIHIGNVILGGQPSQPRIGVGSITVGNLDLSGLLGGLAVA